MADFNLTQVNSLSVLLQSEYNALSTKDPDTLYVAKESSSSNKSNIYLGTKSMNDVIIINNPDTEDVNEGRLYITYDTNSVCLFTVENGEIKVISSGGSGSVTLDDFLSLTSENGVMNKTLSWHTINDVDLNSKNSTYPRPINNDTNYNICLGSFSVGYYNALNRNQDVVPNDNYELYDGFLTIKNGAHLVYSAHNRENYTEYDSGHSAGLSIITGAYNIPDNTRYSQIYRNSMGTGPRFRKWAFTIGNGYLDNLGVHRSNAATIGFDGNSYFQGDVYGNSEWNSSSGGISSARRLAYYDEIPAGPSDSNVVSFVVNYSDMSCDYDYDDVLEMITAEDAKDKIFIAYVYDENDPTGHYLGPYILHNEWNPGARDYIVFILNDDVSKTVSSSSFVDNSSFSALVVDESGWSKKTVSKQSFFSQHIGTESSHPAIGSTNRPVYVNSNGQIVQTDKSFDEYLPLSGGTLTGNLNIGTNLFGGNGFSFNNGEASSHHYYSMGKDSQGYIFKGYSVGKVGGVADGTQANDAVNFSQLSETNSRVDALSGHGRFLSTWNSSTGLAGTEPTSYPYTYNTGDYFIVSVVSNTTNYKPNGSSYTGTASTTVETNEVAINDTYWFDGTTWQLQKNTMPQIAAITSAEIDAICV